MAKREPRTRLAREIRKTLRALDDPPPDGEKARRLRVIGAVLGFHERADGRWVLDDDPQEERGDSLQDQWRDVAKFKLSSLAGDVLEANEHLAPMWSSEALDEMPCGDGRIRTPRAICEAYLLGRLEKIRYRDAQGRP